MPDLAAVILAAGKSTRMKSKTIKVLHTIAGVPIIRYVLNTAAAVGPSRLALVLGHDGQQVRTALSQKPQSSEVSETSELSPLYVEQKELLGTGHALLQTRPVLEGQASTVLCLYGDMPLIQPQTLRRLMTVHHESNAVMTLVTVGGDDSMGFGRIVRDAGQRVQAIVEEKAATPEILAIKEYNAGIYCFQSDWLWPRLAALPASPIGEYYLTDMLAVAVREGAPVQTVSCSDPSEVLGINTRVHLAQAEAIVRAAICRALMLSGVTMIDPATTYIDATVSVAADTVVYPNTFIQGKTEIGSDCQIGPNSQIRDSVIGDGCRVWASVVEEAIVEDGVSIGPFSHLRPGARIGKNTRLGNFAEVKNSTLGRRVHMAHFSYMGDATVGDDANIGAGAITCNYDGKTKNRTEIGEGAFIGSDTLLVAPVKVGRKARTGAGSVVTHDVPDETLAYGVPARVVKKAD
jgi:bifunctional UDP-N-acetylglucosamine pyrophosphorylase/glucosamine-1-phosphate N-acetyltransferase